MEHTSTKVRTAIYLETSLHEAIRLKAEMSKVSISKIVNEAVRHLLKEDIEDHAAFEERKAEKVISYKALLKSLNGNPPSLRSNHRSTS